MVRLGAARGRERGGAPAVVLSGGWWALRVRVYLASAHAFSESRRQWVPVMTAPALGAND